MSNVKLGIRVRPFTERELRNETDPTFVVNVVDDSTVTITNIKVNTSGAGDSRERVRRYTADYTFDSACGETHPSYASQEKIFQSIGVEVVSSLSEGVSACVLAYGQSATGKTYTMMGTETHPGLVPRICQSLALTGNEVTVSFLEIYNEKVHDLLGGCGEEVSACSSLPRRRGNASKDLRVREHPVKGTYVQNLRRVVVRDIEGLLKLVKEGASRRRTAATRRNSSSSRSHAILELAIGGATVHLADLAGSEKASWEGCGGGRQKEGANINKSLVALSNVISALVTAGSGRGRFVPYRDSALTWLLKDCFTGGAKTFIIATVSPSAECYGESASTLRWAARAKHLPPPKTLVHPHHASRAALQSQLNRLIAELTRHFIRYIPFTGKIEYEDNHWDIKQNKYLNSTNQVNISGKDIDCDSENTEIIMSAVPKTIVPNSESTTSSVASGSSEVINVDGKDINISTEVNKEMDKLFGPALERAKSGTDLKLVAPHRNKRRQYRSHEVLSTPKSLGSARAPLHMPNVGQQNPPEDTKTDEVEALKLTEKQHAPFTYDNEQRAEIVASVTERLYTKLKKKEETTVNKIESIVDKKIMEPLNELRICTNARQRLMDLSRKALKNKRRIGIPAHTQTKKQVIRMKDQAVDIQSDLEPYFIKEKDVYTSLQDAATETANITSRCKDIAVGPKCGSIKQKEQATETEIKTVHYSTSSAMTDALIKSERCTQTSVPIVAPPRRKKRNKLLSQPINRNTSDSEDHNYNVKVDNPVININISHSYSESESVPSNESTDNYDSSTPTIGVMQPDLLTHHKNSEYLEQSQVPNVIANSEFGSNNNTSHLCRQWSDEFPSDTGVDLPRVSINADVHSLGKSMEDLILGRNKDMYPYNIILSPPTEKENYKRSVKFKNTNDYENDYPLHCKQHCMKASPVNKNDTIINSHTRNDRFMELDNTSSDSEGTCIKIEKNNSLQHKHICALKENAKIKPVYYPHKCIPRRSNSTKTKLYKDFLGLDNADANKTVDSNKYSDYDSDSKQDFRRKKEYFEERFEKEQLSPRDSFFDVQKNILSSCDRLERYVNKYDRYLSGSRASYGLEGSDSSTTGSTPREYLQRLVQLRRDTVNEAKMSPTRFKSRVS